METKSASREKDPALQGQNPAASADLPKHQVHHSYIWLGSIRTVITILIAALVTSFSSIAGAIADGDFSTDGIAIVLIFGGTALALLLLIAWVVAYQLLSYKHLYFTLGESEFSLYKGIISKKRVHVPYYRVQSVDQRASLLQRLFGVCTVLIDTAGGSANKAVMVPYLTKHQAEQLRSELFARKRMVAMQNGVRGESSAAVETAAGDVPGAGAADAQQLAATACAAPSAAAQRRDNVLDAGAEAWRELGGLFAGDECDTGRVTYEYGLTNKELALTAASNNSVFVLAVLGLLGLASQAAELVFDVFPHQGELVAQSVADQATSAAAAGFFAVFTGAMLLALVVIWLVSAAATCVGYGGFRARRRDNRIEVERGLLQHTFQGIDVDRVQAVVVKQSFVRRLIGYCEVSLAKIDASSSGDDGSNGQAAHQGVVVHPFVKVGRVPEILAGIVPEYRDLPTESVAVAPVALRRAIIRRCTWQGSGFWLAVCTVAIQMMLNFVSGPQGLADAFEVSLAQATGALGYINLGAMAFYVLAAVLVALDAVGAVLWFRESSMAFNDRFMQLSTGGFSRETTSFPRRKIQFGCVRTNPFQRLAKTATVRVRTAAGVGGTTKQLIDVPTKYADAWLAWVQPRAK